MELRRYPGGHVSSFNTLGPVKANVPNAWEEAIEKLKWCPPFVQIGPQSTGLPALRGVGATDKHHNLVLLPWASCPSAASALNSETSKA